jgi:hypothetical protein
MALLSVVRIARRLGSCVNGHIELPKHHQTTVRETHYISPANDEPDEGANSRPRIPNAESVRVALIISLSLKVNPILAYAKSILYTFGIPIALLARWV